ncbi:MAG: hypothetical protein FWD61_03435 [Phycisphaerales bacterium]|nr:hypothetical protein [Phycisphaerales bacterium]
MNKQEHGATNENQMPEMQSRANLLKVSHPGQQHRGGSGSEQRPERVEEERGEGREADQQRFSQAATPASSPNQAEALTLTPDAEALISIIDAITAHLLATYGNSVLNRNECMGWAQLGLCEAMSTDTTAADLLHRGQQIAVQKMREAGLITLAA